MGLFTRAGATRRADSAAAPSCSCLRRPRASDRPCPPGPCPGRAAMAPTESSFVPPESAPLEGLWRVMAGGVSRLQRLKPSKVATLELDATCIESHKRDGSSRGSLSRAALGPKPGGGGARGARRRTRRAPVARRQRACATRSGHEALVTKRRERAPLAKSSVCPERDANLSRSRAAASGAAARKGGASEGVPPARRPRSKGPATGSWGAGHG